MSVKNPRRFIRTTSSARASRVGGTSRGIRGTEHLERQPGSFRLDARELHHLRPFLGFFGEELAVLSRRERERGVAEVGNPSPDPGIGEASVDLPVDRIDNFGGGGPRGAGGDPAASLLPPPEFGGGGRVPGRLHARR